MFIMPKDLVKLTIKTNKKDTAAAKAANRAGIDKLAKERGIQIIEDNTNHAVRAK